MNHDLHLNRSSSPQPGCNGPPPALQTDLPGLCWAHTALVARSPLMLEIAAAIPGLAASSENLLIRGETGTGKGLLAHLIHRSGPRAAHLFVDFNCGSVPENLLESELFGHERGAFTGANQRHIGHFERAGHGTIFLDEIGEL